MYNHKNTRLLFDSLLLYVYTYFKKKKAKKAPLLLGSLV